MKKDLYIVRYQVTDRGIAHPIKEEEIEVPKGQDVLYCLGKKLRKYRTAGDLSMGFVYEVLSSTHIGKCN